MGSKTKKTDQGIHRTTWYGWLSETCFGWWTCYSACVFGVFYVHWHIGTNPRGWPLKKFYPNFRLRGTSFTWKKKVIDFKIPTMKYYDL